MTHMMNGHPIWCKPARTREYDFLTEEKDDKSELLAELPKLVAKAIEKGLIKRPTIKSTEEKPGPRSESAVCKCGQDFIRKVGGPRHCFQCRTPAKECRHCHQLFHPKKWGQKTCSNECRIEAIKEGARKNAAPTMYTTCPVCQTVFVNKVHGRKATKTCGKQCGIELMKIHNKKKNENQTQ